jgi:predicted ribonuclease YlaK
VPIIVLDELDGLKQRGSTAHVKWRASCTLAVFDDLFTQPNAQGILRQPAADGTRGAVVVDILYDPPRHERLPINDDEIIDRALAAQGVAGAPVTLLTFDTSQAARARHAGLAVNKLAKATRGGARRHPQQEEDTSACSRCADLTTLSWSA